MRRAGCSPIAHALSVSSQGNSPRVRAFTDHLVGITDNLVGNGAFFEAVTDGRPPRLDASTHRHKAAADGGEAEKNGEG